MSARPEAQAVAKDLLRMLDEVFFLGSALIMVLNPEKMRTLTDAALDQLQRQAQETAALIATLRGLA